MGCLTAVPSVGDDEAAVRGRVGVLGLVEDVVARASGPMLAELLLGEGDLDLSTPSEAFIFSNIPARPFALTLLVTLLFESLVVEDLKESRRTGLRGGVTARCRAASSTEIGGVLPEL